MAVGPKEKDLSLGKSSTGWAFWNVFKPQPLFTPGNTLIYHCFKKKKKTWYRTCQGGRLGSLIIFLYLHMLKRELREITLSYILEI